jgi:NAD(P)-dependent dehydrogenase (short-subunit alcohol dehydrogenase family)
MGLGRRFKRALGLAKPREIPQAPRGDLLEPDRFALDVEKWSEHRFGLCPDRWAGLAELGVWITGAGTGYGKALTSVLALAGAEVILSSRRREVLDTCAEEIRSRIAPDARLHVLPMDLGRLDTHDDLTSKALELCPKLGCLVNSAALPQTPQPCMPLLEGDADAFQAMLRVNALGPWRLMRSLLESLAGKSAVRIVNLTSAAGWADTPGFGPYNVSKCTLNSLTRNLAAEARQAWPEADIQINGVDPGQARTEMNQGVDASPLLSVPVLLRLLSAPADAPSGLFYQRDGSVRPFGDQQGQ